MQTYLVKEERPGSGGAKWPLTDEDIKEYNDYKKNHGSRPKSDVLLRMEIRHIRGRRRFDEQRKRFGI